MAQDRMEQNKMAQNKMAQNNQEEQTFCLYCGAHIDVNAKFCGNCGNKVEGAPSPQKSKKGGRWKVAVAAVIIGVILAAAAVFATVQMGIWNTDGSDGQSTEAGMNAEAGADAGADTEAGVDADITKYANGDTAAAVDPEHVVVDEDTGITYIDNRLIVFTAGELSEEDTAALAETVNGDVVGDISGMINMLQIQVSVSSLEELEEMAALLEEEDAVAYAGYDFPIRMESEDTDDGATTDDGSTTDDVTSATDDGSTTDNGTTTDEETTADDEEAVEGSWWVEAIGADIAWQYSSLCERVTIGIIDNGFDLDHPDLTREDETAVISLLDDFSGNSEADHGTHVAGIIAAQDNEVGMRGIADTADVIAADYTPEEDEDEVLISTGEYAIVMEQMIEEEGVCVINNSWGEYIYSEKGYAKQIYYDENTDYSICGYYAAMDDQSITLSGVEFPFSVNDIEHADFYINNEIVTQESFRERMELDLEQETSSKGTVYLVMETGDDGETQYVTEVHYLSTDYDFEEEINSLDYDHYMESVEAESDKTGFFCIILITQILEYSADNGNTCEDFLIVQSAGNGYDNGEFVHCGYDTSLKGTFCAVDEELFNDLADNYPALFEGYDIDYQSIADHIIIVGAVQNSQTTDGEYLLTAFSNYGDNIDICAPGETIYSTLVDGYGNASGTSMAAPIVSASAALVWSLTPDLTAGEMKELLISTAGTAVGVTGEDNGKSYPMLDLGSAVTETVEANLGTITGTVTDGDTGKILTGVTCTLKTDVEIGDYIEMKTTYDADDGYFCFSAVGNCTVTLEKEGYEPAELTVTVGLRKDVDMGEVAMTPLSDEEVLQAKLDELIENYGIFASGQGTTISDYDVSAWLDPTGILSATILDLDADGNQEMLVCRTKKWEYRGTEYYKIRMEVYEVDSHKATLADSLWFEPYGDSKEDNTSYKHMYSALMDTETSKVYATVNLVWMESGYYIVCEYQDAGVLGDGGYSPNWVLEYQYGSLQYVCSLESPAGSDVEAEFAYEFEDGVNTKTTMYYAYEITETTDLSYWDGSYTDLGKGWISDTEFFREYGLEFPDTEIQSESGYTLFNHYGFRGTTYGESDTELGFRLLIYVTDSDYSSGTFVFEEELTRGNDLLGDIG